MAHGPFTFYDSFSETRASGWGTLDTGQTWSGHNVTWSEGGGLGRIQVPANTGLGTARISLPQSGVAAQNHDSILMRVRWSAPAQWPLTDFGPILSHNGNNASPTFYYFALQGNWSEVAIGVYINGYRYELNRKAVSINKNTDYWVRFERTHTGMRAKVWKFGTLEPTSWTVTSGHWDGSQPIGVGSPGVFKKGTRDAYDIEIKDFYHYAATVAEKTTYPSDTFNRTVTQGWGISTSGHVWEGANSVSPFYPKTPELQMGSVSNNTGNFRMDAAEVNSFSYIGPRISADVETFAKFSIGGGNGVGEARIGLKGTPRSPSTTLGDMDGYVVVVVQGRTYISIWKRVSGVWTNIVANAAIGTTITQDVNYNVKFQKVGSTLRARVWQDGTTEPTTWHATTTDTAFTTGYTFVGGYQGSSGYRNIHFKEIRAQVPTADPEEIKNFSTTGSLSATPSETSVAVTATITNDENNNGTITAKYKPSSASAWVSYSGSIGVSGKNRTFTITGLQPNTSYDIQVTWQDVDGVRGGNPQNLTTSTLSRDIEGKDITVSNVSGTSVSVEASYLRDSDDDATATVAYRMTSMNTDVVEDYFVDEDDGEFLQNIDSNRGGDWIKHSASTPEINAIVRQMRLYANTRTLEDKVLYYHTTTTPANEYDVVGEFFAAKLAGHTGVAGRLSATEETYYGAGVDAEATANHWQWEIFKVVDGVKTTLDTKPFSSDIGIIYEIKLVIRSAYKALVVNGVELLRTTDNEITDQGHAGYYTNTLPEGSETNQFLLDSFFLTYRSPAGSWSSEQSMTMDRVARKASRTITGLNSSTIYEFRVSFTDGDGTTNTPLLITAQTVGESIELSDIVSNVQATSAIVDVFYKYDTNNNSFINFQYKSVMDDVWRTIPFMDVRADREVKKFSVTIGGLIPSLTYEVRATVTDSDGIMQGTPESLYDLFTTTGFVVSEDRQEKHYVWKVYSPHHGYVGTIHDAPEPEFSLHQNGGVTDLSFNLNRTFQDIQAEKMIQFQNRVDIWAVDPSSRGMGPNLIDDSECDISVGAWTLGSNASYAATSGPDGSSALKIHATNDTQVETLSSTIDVAADTPLVVSCIARATGAKLRMYVQAFNINDLAIDSSHEIAETIGTDWQELRLNYTTPEATAYVRVTLRNTGRGTMLADKFLVLTKEMLVYRGKIESFTPKIDENGESVTVEVLGLVSQLSDDYIEFLQFVEIQPAKDIEAKRVNYGAKDPGEMMKLVIDTAKRQNTNFALYYTSDSIRNTGQLAQYTFRDQQIRSCMDKIRNLCPSGWHYLIEADGLVILRGPEHAPTHTLRLGVELLRLEVEKSIRNLKNFVRVKGRQDEDANEPDGHGSINYTAFDQKSIDKYGKRMVFIRDAQLTDPDTARLVGDGRLDEYNREEQRARAYVPDEKGYYFETGALRGYNIEALRPGDNVVILDPLGSPRNSYWNRFRWDEDAWDMSNAYTPLPEPVPIITVQNHSSYAQLELSERPPSQVGDFSRLFRWMADKESD